MSAPRSATGRALVAGWIALAALAIVAMGWSVMYSVFRDGPSQAGFATPTEIIQAAKSDAAKERRKVWLALLTTLLVPSVIAIGVLAQPRKLYGDAKFGRAQDVTKAGLRAKWGLTFGNYGGRLLVAAPPANVLGCAPPGGGKGVGWVIPTLLNFRGSCVVLDPKRENWERTAGFRARYSAGGDVVLFDPFNEDGEGWRYNPLAEIGAGVRRIDEVDRIAQMLWPDPLNGEVIWAASARELFSGMVLALADLRDQYEEAVAEGRSDVPEPSPVSIGSVFRLAVDQGDCGARCNALAQRVRDPLARRLLGAFAALPTKQAEGVLGTLKERIGLWKNPAIDAATSASDFSFRDLRRRRVSIYLGLAPSNIERLAPLLALMFQQAVDAMTRALPGKDEPYPFLLLIDEFAMLGRMPVLANAMAFLRGYGGSVFLIVQSPAQLDVRYGAPGRRAIVDTCKYRVFYSPNDLETAEALSRELGTYTVQNRSRSRSARGGGSTSVNQAKRELLLPQEILQMDRNAAILLVEGMRPIKGRKLRYFEDRELSQRSALPCPAVPQYPIELEWAVPQGSSEASERASDVELTPEQLVEVEEVSAERTLGVVLVELEVAEAAGAAGRAEELKDISRSLAQEIPRGRPDDPAAIAALMRIGAR